KSLECRNRDWISDSLRRSLVLVLDLRCRRSGRSDLIAGDPCESWCLRICPSPLESRDMLAST
ncbi:4341_t:CDS:2, partial [Scutellospora calospora]